MYDIKNIGVCINFKAVLQNEPVFYQFNFYTSFLDSLGLKTPV